MRDDDLLRRLEKLVALRDHPSTLPTIREEASKAADRIQLKFFRPAPDAPLSRGNIRIDPLFDDLLGVMNRETRRIWEKVKTEAIAGAVKRRRVYW